MNGRPEVYGEMRQRVLDLDPTSVGISPSPTLPRVWGLVMDMGYLGHRRHPLADVFHAAHDVITELRLLDETRRR